MSDKPKLDDMATEILLTVGQMIGTHESNMALFRQAGLLAIDCDATLVSLSAVLYELARRLRAGETIEIRPTIPDIDP